MNVTTPPSTPVVSRREFVGRSAGLAGAVVGGVSARADAAAAAETENPWRYDVEALRRVDPALVHFERFVRFPVDHPAPRRLAVGPDDRLHVAAGRSVLVFSAEGGRVGEFTVGEIARCVRVSGDGRIWVGFRDHVEVYEGKGRRVAQWGALSGKPFVTGIGITEREVYVADAGNRVVYRCDPDGRIRLRLGERDGGRKVPGLVLPSPFLDVEPGADGLLRVNNPGRHVVESYTRDGELEGSWGRAGVAIDAFCGCCNPISLALLPDGRCLTAEKGLPRVKLYTPDGRLESVVAAPADFAPVNAEDRAETVAETVNDGLDVAVDGRGRVWVLDLVGLSLHGYRRKGPGRRGRLDVSAPRPVEDPGTRREFLRHGLRVAGLTGAGVLAGVMGNRTSSADTVWQIDPRKCLCCSRCATECVLEQSAVKCVNWFPICGYCDLCTGYFEPQPNALNTAAENQLCPTSAILRKFVEDPYYEYRIDEDLCIGCAKCVEGCRLFGNGSFHLQVRHDRCLNCNECAIARVCPGDAFRRVPAGDPHHHFTT